MLIINEQVKRVRQTLTGVSIEIQDLLDIYMLYLCHLCPLTFRAGMLAIQ